MIDETEKVNDFVLVNSYVVFIVPYILTAQLSLLAGVAGAGVALACTCLVKRSYKSLSQLAFIAAAISSVCIGIIVRLDFLNLKEAVFLLMGTLSISLAYQYKCLGVIGRI